MNNLTSSPISFSSRIKFVSNSEYQRVTNGMARDYTNPNYIGDPWDRAVTSKEALTEDIYGCNAGGLTNRNSNEVTLFHYKPISSIRFEERVKNSIQNALSQMSQYTEQLGALIIGGKTPASGDNNYSNSEKLSNQLKDLFESFGATVSKIWGQTTSSAHTNIFYSADQDTWYVNYKNKGSYIDKEINTPEDIKNAYFYIDISDNDQVFIDDREVEKFDLNQFFKKIDGGYELDYSYRNPFYQKQYDYGAGYRPNETVKIYLADFGQDRSTLWIDSDKPLEIQKVLEKIDDIKQSSMFRDITKIEFASNTPVEGFEDTGRIIDGKCVSRKTID